MHKTDKSKQERRQYIRLDSVFPVQFRVLSLDGKSFLSDWLQGFTNNISRGGICLSVNNLNPKLAQSLKTQQAKLTLEIEMPVVKVPVAALAAVIWFEDLSAGGNRYLFGLKYEDIDHLQNKRIMQYARAKKMFIPFVLSVVAILFCGVLLNGYINLKLINGNKALVEQLVKILQDSSVAKQKIKEISRERQELQLAIQSAEQRIKTLEEEKTGKEKGKSEKIEQLNTLIAKLSQEKGSLEQQLIVTQHKENSVAEELLRLDKRKSVLEKANVEKMYQWLEVHQNARTGLVMSFEGDSDIADWAFIYDQALVLQAYANFSDFERARKILEFFNKRAKREGGLFFNAYFVNDGSPSEYVVHVGPNVWLGIAALQYIQRAKDQSYLPLAEEIARSIISLQNQDAEGGLRGGPNVEWYSTEHNLDAYAFFNMLHKITGKPEYLKARDKALNWLAKNTYNKGDVPIKRGKGDSTIATDTYAWSIAAIGPEKLIQIGMNPDRIMEFAEQNCSVEVSYARPGGQTIKIKGFDFAPQRHTARGGVVSSEWTAQMVLSFKIMADFYYKKEMVSKARAYELKADTYLAELGNMIISSPSPSGQGESCLPYATQDYVDTGHGWMTPKGSSTGSVSGTAYTIFAYYKYNPLELKE